MKEKMIFEITKAELLRLFQDWYNKNKSTNHAFSIITDEVPEKIEIELVKWDKDEISH